MPYATEFTLANPGCHVNGKHMPTTRRQRLFPTRPKLIRYAASLQTHIKFILDAEYSSKQISGPRVFHLRWMHTDYEVELFVNPSNGLITAVMTRWINLGAGLSPDDPRWRINAGCKWGESDLRTRGLGYGHIIPSPRRTFEALTDTSLGDLTARNLSYLENQRYQTEIVPIPHSTPPSWALWNGAAIP